MQPATSHLVAGYFKNVNQGLTKINKEIKKDANL